MEEARHERCVMRAREAAKAAADAYKLQGRDREQSEERKREAARAVYKAKAFLMRLLMLEDQSTAELWATTPRDTATWLTARAFTMASRTRIGLTPIPGMVHCASHRHAGEEYKGLAKENYAYDIDPAHHLHCQHVVTATGTSTKRHDYICRSLMAISKRCGLWSMWQPALEDLATRIPGAVDSEQHPERAPRPAAAAAAAGQAPLPSLTAAAERRQTREARGRLAREEDVEEEEMQAEAEEEEGDAQAGEEESEEEEEEAEEEEVQDGPNHRRPRAPYSHKAGRHRANEADVAIWGDGLEDFLVIDVYVASTATAKLTKLFNPYLALDEMRKRPAASVKYAVDEKNRRYVKTMKTMGLDESAKQDNPLRVMGATFVPAIISPLGQRSKRIEELLKKLAEVAVEQEQRDAGVAYTANRTRSRRAELLVHYRRMIAVSLHAGIAATFSANPQRINLGRTSAGGVRGEGRGQDDGGREEEQSAGRARGQAVQGGRGRGRGG